VRLTFAADMLAVNKTNLEAANGRIADVDIASESANLARLNILQQAGTAMLAQANQMNKDMVNTLLKQFIN
jgi:flagellin